MKLNQSLKNRHKKIFQVLSRQSESAALLLSSAVSRQRNYDNTYPYRQESNFWYCTASHNEGLVLLFVQGAKKAILFAPPKDAHRDIWDGSGEEPQTIARRIGAELRVTKNLRADVLAALQGTHELFYDASPGIFSQKFAAELCAMPAFSRIQLPKRLTLADILLAPLRQKKDSYELSCIQSAADLVCDALHAVLPLIQPGVFEYEIQSGLEYFIKAQGADISFPPIVACGSNAATLHYRMNNKPLKAGETLLIDFGAEWEGYASDITRVFPVSGRFSPRQAMHYEAVLRAQEAAISTIRPGKTIGKVYEAAHKEICSALRDMGVLKGSLASLLKKGAAKEYFPHGIGHSLGLDVHDVGQLRSGLGQLRRGSTEKLETGMVITIEPGIYFQKPKARFPRSGIRIEDDVLITRSGARVMTDGFPKELGEIEDLLQCGFL